MPNPFDQFDAPAANPFDQFDGGTVVAEPPASPDAGRRAAKKRELMGELVAERRSGQGASFLQAAAGGIEGAVDLVSKLNPLTVIPRAAWAVSEQLTPTGAPFPLENSQPVIPVEKWTPEMAAQHLRTTGVSPETIAGVANAVSDFGEFFLTPEGLATLGAGQAPAAARAALGAGFSGQMSSHLPEAAAQAGELSAGDDKAEAVRAGLGTLGTAVFAGAIPIGAIAHGRTPRVLPPAERAGKMLEAAVNDPALLARLEQTANDLALERTQPERGLRVERPDRANPFDQFDKEPSPATPPTTAAPAATAEAATPGLPPPSSAPADLGAGAASPRPPAGPETIAPAAAISPAPVESQSRAVAPQTELRPVAGETQSTTAFDPSQVPTVEFPLAQLKLSKDVPNFKGGASEETGTVAGQELAGTYQRTGTAPIVVWERLNGDTEVITGRHRFDLARRTGEKTIPAQVVREADGFTKDQALTFDAEANIRDGQGEVADYATYFKGTEIPEAEARARGLLSRAKGKAGWSLAKAATDDVYALWRADKLTDAQAVAIANAAPGDAGAQQIGSKFALQGKGADFIANVIKASKAEAGQRAESLDLFGKDDSAMKTMAEQAERASQFQRDLVEQIRAVQGAAKRPEAARKLGVDVKDPEGVVKRIGELKAELAQWENWPMQPDLVAKVRGERVEAKVEVKRPEPGDYEREQHRTGNKRLRERLERLYPQLREQPLETQTGGPKAAGPTEAVRPTGSVKQGETESLSAAAVKPSALEALRAQAAQLLVETRNFHPEDAAKYAQQLGGVKELEGFLADNSPAALAKLNAVPSGGELFAPAEMPFNLAAETAPKEFVAPTATTTGFGTETLVQRDLFAIEKVVESRDPRKSADAAQAMYGSPAAAAKTIRKQLATVDADKEVKKTFAKEQRQRLAEVLNLLEQRAEARPEIIGMGGAVPSEFSGGQRTPTGIKNATVDAERARRGLPPAMEAARRDWGSVWDEAMARVDTDPAVQDRLIAELKEKPRALTDTEDALLLHRQIDLQNEYGRITRELAVAYEDSAAFPNRLADVEALKVRTAEVSDQLLDLYNVNKAAGTETGRGLAARKMMANENFTLAAMEMEKRAANGGAPLTDAERSAMAKLQERIVDLEAKAVAREEQVATERAGRMTDEAIADMKRELASKPSYDPRIVKIAEEIVGKLEKQADKSRAFLKGKFLSPTPEDIYHLGVIGAAKIARLGLDFSKFSIEMAAEFGDGVKPYLQAAWERANLHLENEGAKYGDKAEPVKRLLRKRDAEGQREGVIEGLKKGVEEGLPVGLLGDYVRKLALSFVRGGITERNALVDAVHKVLTEDIGMELSRRETMDAISGYGRFSPLSADAAKAQLRDLKGQMQQVAKLEDITAKKPLQKTGVERRTQSDEERRLIQQVNEAKRRFGVIVTDPARQLKSALDAVRTRLKHQVADLEYQIATKERIVKSKTDAPFDAETKLLETRRDALRAQLDELVPKPGRTDAQLLEVAVRTVERSIADYEARIAGGEMNLKRAKPDITSPQLAALKARRDAVRAEWQELRELDGEFQRQQAEAALTRQKSALEEAIAAKEKQLAEGPKPPAGREVSRPADPVLEELMQKRDALNRQLAEARKKPWEVKHAENVARRLAAMEESIAEREAKLAAGDLSTEARAKVARPMADPVLEQARQKLDDVNRRLAEARKPKLTPEERALKALHTRLTTSAAEYADRLARGDFAPRVRKPVPTDPTTLRLKAEAERAKVEWREGLERDRLKHLTRGQRAGLYAKEALNVPRAVLASWDVSAVLRQGGFITLAHPARALSSLGPMFRALLSDTRAHMVEQEIRARANAPLYARAKLFLAPLDTSKLTAMEELFMSRLSRAIPGVRASERAYITFLNKLRADSFDAMVERMQAKGTPLTDLELQAVGNFINVSTGRGNMGSHAAAAETLATVFFSPRLVVSRFQLLTGQPLRKAGSARVARAVAAEYAGFLGGLAVVYALANMAGAEVETDPRSSDFGKLRFGNTRVDPLAGLAQATVLLSREFTGETKTMSGKVRSLYGDLPYGADTAWDVLTKFLRTKLSPVVGAAVDLRTGENVIGEKRTTGETLQRLAVPLSFEDIYKVMLEDGIPKGTALGILSLFGWGLQQHDPPKPKRQPAGR